MRFRPGVLLVEAAINPSCGGAVDERPRFIEWRALPDRSRATSLRHGARKIRSEVSCLRMIFGCHVLEIRRNLDAWNRRILVASRLRGNYGRRWWGHVGSEGAELLVFPGHVVTVAAISRGASASAPKGRAFYARH